MSEDKNTNPQFHEIHGAHEEEVRRVLSKMKHESEEQQAAGFAAALGLPYIDLNIFPIDPETLRTIPKVDAQKYSVVCLLRAGKNVSLASPNPENPELVEFVEKLKQDEGFTLKFYVCSTGGLEKSIEKYKHIALIESLEDMRLSLTGADLEEFEHNLKDVIDLKKRITEIPTTEVLNIVVAGAVKMEASDIHFEPQQDGIRLRYVAESGFYAAGAILLTDKTSFDSLKEQWANTEMLSLKSEALFDNGSFNIALQGNP